MHNGFINIQSTESYLVWGNILSAMGAESYTVIVAHCLHSREEVNQPILHLEPKLRFH